MDRFGGRYSTPRSLPYVLWSSEASTTWGSASDPNADVQLRGPFRMNHLHAALPGLGHTDEGHYGRKWREPHPAQAVYAASGHGQVLSPAWRLSPDRTLVGGVSWAPWSPGRSSDGSGGSGSVDGFAYCLDRGNGQVTRLIPADVLPPLNEIPAREADRRGMVVLAPLQVEPPRGVAETNQRVTVKHGREHASEPAQASLASVVHLSRGQSLSVPQKHMDRIAAASIPTLKRSKIYCDKWIHEGVCAFTQQGCKFKHEMPADEQTQRSLGLFQGLPGWWRKRQEEASPRRAMPPSPLETCSRGRGEMGGFLDAAPKGPPWRERRMAEAPRLMSPPRKFCNNGRPSSIGSDLVPFKWGPIGTPARRTPTGSGFCNDNTGGARVYGHGGPKHAGQTFVSKG